MTGSSQIHKHCLKSNLSTQSASKVATETNAETPGSIEVWPPSDCVLENKPLTGVHRRLMLAIYLIGLFMRDLEQWSV